MDEIDDIRSNIVLRRIVERLATSTAPSPPMLLEEAAFRPLGEAIRQAFNGGGVATIEVQK